MRLYEIISEYGVPDYNTMPTYKLKRAKKGKHKFFVPSNEPTPKGVQAIENVTDYPEITQSKKEEIINAWEYQEDLIDIGNGYKILSGENHGRADNVALLIGPDYKIKDEDDNINDLLDNNFGIIQGENFADGKVKGKSRPGRVKKAGASCKGSVSSLRAKAKKYSGEKGKMYHWCANMKSGKSNS